MRHRPGVNAVRVKPRGKAVAGILAILAVAGVLPMLLVLRRPATRMYHNMHNGKGHETGAEAQLGGCCDTHPVWP